MVDLRFFYRRPYGRNGRALFVEFLGSFFFAIFFHDLPSQIAFFKLRYITFFLMYATTLYEPLISYFDSGEKQDEGEQHEAAIKSKSPIPNRSLSRTIESSTSE